MQYIMKKLKGRKGWRSASGEEKLSQVGLFCRDTYPNLLPCDVATSFSIANKFQRVWFWFAIHQMESLFRTERCTCTYQLCSKSDRM